jgi:hypothetical protein
MTYVNHQKRGTPLLDKSAKCGIKPGWQPWRRMTQELATKWRGFSVTAEPLEELIVFHPADPALGKVALRYAKIPWLLGELTRQLAAAAPEDRIGLLLGDGALFVFYMDVAEARTLIDWLRYLTDSSLTTEDYEHEAIDS